MQMSSPTETPVEPSSDWHRAPRCQTPADGPLGLPFADLNLRRNPFGELEARKAWAGQEAAAVFSAGAASPAAGDLASAGMTLSMGSEVTFRQPPPGEPSPAEGAPEPAPPAIEQQVAPGTAAIDTALREILDRLGAASRYGSARDEIIRQFAERSFPCSIEIDAIERTYTYVPDQRFRNGRTVTGVLRGTDCEVAVQLPEERNQQLDTLGPGDTLQANCTLLKWNNIHDRLEIREI